ncbi:hypothetical protein HAL07_13430 [Helicobacter ailurogastricus]|uniref:Uncharacterized protein n=1 Tax=Helicobacter ailurogastricus TaxID=1578720 RepID=A0A0K2Y1S1_9HELI|nr:hypothetical protein HAL07_13430 [Helicobacter ailurogastricus]
MIRRRFYSKKLKRILTSFKNLKENFREILNIPNTPAREP